MTSTSGEDAVRFTAIDALQSKVSAVKFGYYEDNFVHPFVPRSTADRARARREPRRSPLINRGYYARFRALESIILDFLRCGGGPCRPKQVVSLGAGNDTTFFRLAEMERCGKLQKGVLVALNQGS